MRDDFPEKTKRILALRAGYRCSCCRRLTAGPSEEGPMAVASIGVAAHISAASAGGKRYLQAISEEERSSIENGIWLCANHAILIDRDDSRYTIEALKEIKQRHEEWCKSEVRGMLRDDALPEADLFAIGPENVFVGDLAGIEEGCWSFQTRHNVIGGIEAFASFIDGFAQCWEYDRYVITNALGDGRVLAGAPSLFRNSEGYLIRCPVEQRFQRIRADRLPTDLDFSGGDLSIKNGDIATVSGLDALPQKIELGLGIRKGEMLFNRGFGARLAEYYELFRGSVWLERLFKLEVVRLAAIPYPDRLAGAHTPLQCVDRVLNVTAAAERDRKVPISVELEVHGLGRWQHDLAVDIG
jgi:hypothetical protein